MERLCSQFSVGSSGLKAYQGNVLIDDEAMYLLVGMNINLVAFAGLGGVIGGAIAGAVMHAKGRGAGLPYETTFGALDAGVRRDPAWGRVAPQARVLVVPRSAVTSVAVSKWMGCAVKTADVTIRPAVSFFRVGRAREMFRRYGWPVAES